MHLTLIAHSEAPASSPQQQSRESFRNLPFPLCILCEMDGGLYLHVRDGRKKHKKYLLNTNSQYVLYVFIFQTNKSTLRAMETLLSRTAFTYSNRKSSLQYPSSFIPRTASTTLNKAEVPWNTSCIVRHSVILPTGQINFLFLSLPLSASVLWKLFYLIVQRILLHAD